MQKKNILGNEFTQMPLTNRIERVMLLERFFQNHGLFFSQPQFLSSTIAVSTVSTAAIVIIAPPRARGPLSGHHRSIIIVPLVPLAAANARHHAVRRWNAVVFLAVRRRFHFNSSYHIGAPICTCKSFKYINSGMAVL